MESENCGGPEIIVKQIHIKGTDRHSTEGFVSCIDSINCVAKLMMSLYTKLVSMLSMHCGRYRQSSMQNLGERGAQTTSIPSKFQ